MSSLLFPRPIEPGKKTWTPSRELTDDQVREQRGANRGILVGRLEELWEHCQDHLNDSLERPDPRYAQLGLSILKEMGALLQLREKAPEAPPEPPEPGEERARLRTAIEAQIADMEARSA